MPQQVQGISKKQEDKKMRKTKLFVGVLLFAIGWIVTNLQECSSDSRNYNSDINIEQPIHRDR